MEADTDAAKKSWVAIARILRAQGRHGEVVADLLTDLDPTTQFAAGRQVSLAATAALASAPQAASTIENSWLPTGKNAGRIVLKFAGCDSISAAEALRGQEVLIPASELPKLEDDTFYVQDLLGCVLVDGDREVGTVVDVHFATSPDGRTRLAEAAPLLAVQPAETPTTEPILVPFVRAQLESVDVAAKRIVMQLPAGLFDTTDTDGSL